MRGAEDLEIADRPVAHVLLVQLAVLGLQVGFVLRSEDQAQLRHVDLHCLELRLEQIEVVEGQATATVDQFTSRHQDGRELAILQRAPVVGSQCPTLAREGVHMTARHTQHLVVGGLHLLDVAYHGVLRVEGVQQDVLRHVLALYDTDRIGVVVDEYLRLDTCLGQVQRVVVDQGAEVFGFVQEVTLLDGLLFDDVSPKFFFDRHICLILISCAFFGWLRKPRDSRL